MQAHVHSAELPLPLRDLTGEALTMRVLSLNAYDVAVVAKYRHDRINALCECISANRGVRGSPMQHLSWVQATQLTTMTSSPCRRYSLKNPECRSRPQPSAAGSRMCGISSQGRIYHLAPKDPGAACSRPIRSSPPTFTGSQSTVVRRHAAGSLILSAVAQASPRTSITGTFRPAR